MGEISRELEKGSPGPQGEMRSSGGTHLSKIAVLSDAGISTSQAQRAEHAISKANPPRPLAETGRGHKGVALDDTFPSTTLRDMRAVHSRLTDEQFEARVHGLAAEPRGAPVKKEPPSMLLPEGS